MRGVHFHFFNLRLFCFCDFRARRPRSSIGTRPAPLSPLAPLSLRPARLVLFPELPAQLTLPHALLPPQPPPPPPPPLPPPPPPFSLPHRGAKECSAPSHSADAALSPFLFLFLFLSLLLSRMHARWCNTSVPSWGGGKSERPPRVRRKPAVDAAEAAARETHPFLLLLAFGAEDGDGNRSLLESQRAKAPGGVEVRLARVLFG